MSAQATDPPAGLKPHSDLLATFPYTGPPHPEVSGRS